MKKNAVVYTVPTVLLLFAVIPMPAYAIQAHAAPEGLYVHQFGHILFAVAMFGFAYRIRHSRLAVDKAWRFMASGAVLFALWNGWAFSGHILDKMIPPTHFSTGDAGLRSVLDISTSVDALYYIFKMDHLLCVPALIFIYLALKRMSMQAGVSAAGEDES